MSREPTKATPEAVINAAYDLATVIAEGSQNGEALTLVAESIDDALAAATGQRTQEDIDRLAARLMVTAVGEVGIHDSPTQRALQERTAESWLSFIGDTRAQALLDRLRWNDATDPVEPWDAPEAALPAPSSPPASVRDVAYPADPTSPGEPSEANGDNTEQGGETDDDTTDDPEVEVVDAEIVEVEQVTSAQRRYRMPAGSYYSPANRPGLTRSITRGKPTVAINTDSPHLDDQR